MSDVNKLDNKQCPFDLSKYKSNDVVAPVGSVPWAIIQVYEGKAVGRTEWNSLAEYIHLSTKNDGSAPIYIEKHNKDGISEAWEPTPEDLMACDWALVKIEVKPADCMLSFDLKVGTSQYDDGQDWGYLTKDGHLSTDQSTFGTLTNLQSTIGIGNILTFYSEGTHDGVFGLIELQVDTQNQPDLWNKNLEVVVKGSTYNLGSSSSHSTTDFEYTSDGAKQLGDLLTQNVDKTLYFCFNWK
ncbi:conserved protein of unknown function [Xenorhabdus poinarii G6]|uniref:DUF2829 domain-containing protein n=1 Tax=Xenorhabdus poinarii G6 TaxID=1354304 RepID=A0A068R467_9GAMM|nr:MW1434 family type I TA system toxin [Xenorhabdus poinarii]CDG21696.1 conserved protein of unknown function [Xenorhabdus poinarii G6]